MSLSHRFSLLIGLLLLALSMTLLVSVNNSRTYLNLQLSSHAQDTATSLGLALSTALAKGDQATVISMTNAIFDRGDYLEIRVEDNTGQPVFTRTNHVQVENIPGWFVRWLPLRAPEEIAQVMTGWRQSGQVLVKSHPGYAYVQLWDNSHEIIAWIGFSGLLALAIGLFILRKLMTPLKQVEAQADAICRREFPEVSPLPKTPEFTRIVVAMNRMSRKVKEIIGNLETLALKLQAQAYQHPVTGLANKRHFTDTLADLLNGGNKSGSGSLILIQLQDFKHYNAIHGYQAGDELLQKFAERLLQVVEDRPNILVGHLSGADFALLAEDMGHKECNEMLPQLLDSVADLRYFGLVDTSEIAHLGAVVFEGPMEVAALLAKADEALRTAQTKGPSAIHTEIFADTGSPDARSASDWRREIGEAIEQDRLSCLLQPVVRCPERQLLHYELLARLELNGPDGDQGCVVTAGRFVPVAASIGLGPTLDRAIIRQAMDLLGSSRHAGHRLAVNITPNTLADPAFAPWLLNQLDNQPETAKRLVLEMPEFGLTGHMPAVRELIDQLHRRGARFGLDRYGRTERSITNLKALKLDHIKIDGAFVQSLESHEENQFFVEVLADIAHGLDIEVMVEAVENDAVWQVLPGLKVDGAQGYFLGRPE